MIFFVHYNCYTYLFFAILCSNYIVIFWHKIILNIPPTFINCYIIQFQTNPCFIFLTKILLLNFLHSTFYSRECPVSIYLKTPPLQVVSTLKSHCRFFYHISFYFGESYHTLSIEIQTFYNYSGSLQLYFPYF